MKYITFGTFNFLLMTLCVASSLLCMEEHDGTTLFGFLSVQCEQSAPVEHENMELEQVHTSKASQLLYTCPQCDEIIEGLSQFLRHKRAERRPMPYSIDHMYEKIATKENFLFAEPSAMDVQTFTCQHCAFSSTHAADLAEHIKIHEKAKPFKCSFQDCAYETKSEEKFKRHMTLHRAEILALHTHVQSQLLVDKLDELHF